MKGREAISVLNVESNVPPMVFVLFDEKCEGFFDALFDGVVESCALETLRLCEVDVLWMVEKGFHDRRAPCAIIDGEHERCTGGRVGRIDIRLFQYGLIFARLEEELDILRATKLGRYGERCAPLPIADVRVGSLIEQELEDVAVVLQDSIHERRVVIVVLQVDIIFGTDPADILQITCTSCSVERCLMFILESVVRHVHGIKTCSYRW